MRCSLRRFSLRRPWRISALGSQSASPFPAEGVAPVTVAVTVADAVAVDIRTDLEGVAIDLPLPWGKGAESRAPLHVQWT